MKDHNAYIAIGSNQGDKISNCQNGMTLFIEKTNSVLISVSQYYITEPLYYEDQDWFLNGVFQIATQLEPEALIIAIKSVEMAFGRESKSVRYGPRPLDLDILLYDHEIYQSDRLQIPHPMMHERRFVLEPMCDIAPDLIHPVLNMSMRYMLNQLGDKDKKVIPIK